jgi:hypothetical protein
MPDEQSAIVQAADVVGNFAMSYLFVTLGATSAKRLLKARIFEDSFGSSLDVATTAPWGVVVGDDIQLSQPGALTLRLSAA